MLVAALLAIVYLALGPSSGDLAAQTFRADLFSAHGFLLWNDDWYGGHYLPGYSLLFPPLGAALGPRLVGAVAVVIAAGLFGALARHRYGDRARLATLWFGIGAATMLFAGQITFALGVAIGLGSMLALQRSHPVAAGILALLVVCASPVAGLFVGLAGLAVIVTGDRFGGGAVAVGAAVGLAALALAFPTEGYFPFVVSAFLPVPLLVGAGLLLLPPEERVLRSGLVLYGVLALAAFAFHTPVGANAARLGSLFGGPVLAAALVGRRPVALAVVALPLLYWQWVAPVREIADAIDDPSVKESYYEPLVSALDRRAGEEPVRIEIPPTLNRWEADFVAPRFSLARGWLRQLESDDFDLFTGGNLTPDAYKWWLDDRGVSYVALPDASLDYLAGDEAALIRGGLPYLRPVWSNEHWHLYRVKRPAGLMSRAGDLPGPAGPRDRLTELGPASFALAVRDPGPYLVRVHYTPYWTVTAGNACVERNGDWTRVEVRAPGPVAVSARFSLGGLVGRGRECSA
jgi:hypothetical protein